jgi:hypothetical protein
VLFTQLNPLFWGEKWGSEGGDQESHCSLECDALYFGI